MKKIVLTMMAAMVAVVMDAQIYAGGSVGFQTVSHDGNSTTAFTLKPEVGYNLNEDWAIGMAFGYSEKGKDESKVKTFIINPYVRYNAVKLDKVTLAYNLTDWCRLNFTAQNIFTITNYEGVDPEVAGGIDNNMYPRSRNFILGASFNF